MSAIKGLYHDLVERCLDGDQGARDVLIDECDEPLALYGINSTLDAVAEYAAFGITVIPQIPRQKRPPIKWKDYQTTPPSVRQLYDWFVRDYPESGMLAVLGERSNLTAIDVDGREANDALVNLLGAIPGSPRVKSGNPDPYRFHLFFSHPGFKTKAVSRPHHKNLEVKGDRSIIVLPRSSHSSGRRYEWVAGKSLWETRLPPLPPPILEALRQEADGAGGWGLRPDDWGLRAGGPNFDGGPGDAILSGESKS